MTSVHSRGDVRIFHKECRTLASAGYDVHLVVADGKGDEKSDEVSIVDIGQTQGGRWARMTATRSRVLCRALELEGQVYHFHDPELLPAGLALRRHGKRVIYDAHEALQLTIKIKPYLPRPLRVIAAYLFGTYEQFVVRRLSAAVTATPGIAQQFLKIQHLTEVVANFPSRSEIEHEPPAWDSRENVVCYQGSISWERGLREMVVGVAHSNCRLLLAGQFSDEMNLEEVRLLPGWESVDELGMLDRAELQAIMGRCRAGLAVLHPCPNYLDSQPIKMFEYMAAGLPVIVSDFPYWRGLLERFRCCLFVNPLKVKEISSAIHWLHEHPKEAEAMGCRGRQAVLQKFLWESEAQKLLALYNSLL